MTNSYSYLLEHNVKPSLQRMAIIKYLLTHKNHPTADDMYNELSKGMPTLSRTTVYNTLKILSENKACLTLTLDEKNVHYDGDTSLHAHFLCKDCMKIIDIPLNEASLSGCESSDFVVDSIEVSYYGYCSKCQKKRIKE